MPQGRLLLNFLVFALFVAGCCAIGEHPSEEGRQGSTGEFTTSPGERVDIGGTEVLVWGEGDYGVVMAHGASYDAASWEEQGQKISGKGQEVLRRGILRRTSWPPSDI